MIVDVVISAVHQWPWRPVVKNVISRTSNNTNKYNRTLKHIAVLHRDVFVVTAFSTT
jgi:hypothetical protein